MSEKVYKYIIYSNVPIPIAEKEKCIDDHNKKLNDC